MISDHDQPGFGPEPRALASGGIRILAGAAAAMIALSIDSSWLSRDLETWPSVTTVAIVALAIVAFRALRQLQRKKANLTKCLSFNSLLWDIASDALIIADDDGRVSYCSPNLERISGRDSGEASSELVRDVLRHAAGRGEFECEFQAPDRHRLLRTLTAKTMRHKSCDKARVIVVRDETARHAVELDLQRERRLYEHIVSDAPLLIVAIAPDGTTEFMNFAAANVTGYRPEELIGRNWWRILYPGDEYKQVETLLADESSFRVRDYEMTLTTKDGAKRVIAWNSANILDATKRISTIVGIGRDVTRMVKLEGELRQAQKMEAIGRLAGGIAHDFNNLLTIILGNHDLLDEALQDDHAAAESLKQLGSAASRAAALTEQLLTFSRRQTLTSQIVDVNDIARGAGSLLERVLGDNIQVVMRLQPCKSRVAINASQLEQILLNLAINARDAMPGGGRLDITTKEVVYADALATPVPDMEAGSYVHISVADTGSGMLPGVVKHIFEPFYTTKEVGQGTGMGLATVYGVVKQCNGQIVVESEPGSGSTFHLYFPSLGADDVMQAADDTAPFGDASLVKQVLVVDDNRDIRSLARRILTGAGYCVHEAALGDEALARAVDGEIDLLLVDVDMPSVGGVETARMLCNAHPRLRVIFMSGHDPQQLVELQESDEHYAFLSKPFTKRQLLRAVETSASTRLPADRLASASQLANRPN
jgi:two-component system cell cycle sensor histidine kinase/response regulator CckA